MTAPVQRRIGIGLGNLKQFTDGIGEFTRNLCTELATRAPALQQTQGIRLAFHLQDSLVGCFGDEVDYLPRQRLHEVWHRQPQRFDVWHTLMQLNRYKPPAGTRFRILTLHDLNFVYFKSRPSQWRNRIRLARLFARTDHLAGNTRPARSDAQRRMGWAGPSSVIYNGVRDLSTHEQVPLPGVQPGHFLLHLSRMARSKNVESLLAMAALWPEMPLVLAGPDRTRNASLREQIAARGLSQVQVFDDVSDAQKAWVYAHCTAFLFPSLTEGFGLPPLEAMHFGKPVFISNLTSLPEVCGDAATAWPDFDPAHMRRLVEQGLLRHEHEQRAEAVRAHALRFNWARAADEYLALYARAWGTGAG